MAWDGLTSLMILAAVGSVARADAVADSTGERAPVISRIVIQAGDVIPPWSAEALTSNPVERWAYDVANWLHISTRPSVIRRELLFCEGEPLDTLKLQESERILRSYVFINEAEITTRPVGPGEVEVRVRTSDNFSFAPGIILESGGGTTDIGFLLVEKNALGFGKEVALQYVHEDYRSLGTRQNSWLLEYRDPQLLGTRLFLQSSASHNDYGSAFATSVMRPFYSSTTRYAGGMDFSWFDGRTQIFRYESVVAEHSGESRSGRAWVGRSWGDQFSRVKLEAITAYEKSLTKPVVKWSGWQPRDTMHVSRTTVEPTLTLRREVNRAYRRMQYLDDYGVVEDVGIGWNAGVGLGMGVPSQPNRKTYGTAGLFGEWSGVLGNHITVVRGNVSARLYDDLGSGRRAWSNVQTDAFVHHYYRGLPRQTLALSIGWRGGWRVDPPYQIVLGGDVGFRGYPAYRFEGTRRLLVNAEDRIFAPWKIATLGFGLVVFADAGYAWPPGEAVDLRDLYSDGGLGLRVYNTRAATSRVSRIDLAFRLRGQRGFQLSFGSEHLFDLFNRRPTPTR